MNIATIYETQYIAARFAPSTQLPGDMEALKTLLSACLTTAWDCQKTILKIRWIEAKTAVRIAFVKTMHSLTFWASSAGLGWGLAASSIGWIVAGF